MKLVYGKDGCGRIVDCGRESLEGNIDDDAKCKSRVLLHGTLRPAYNSGAESLIKLCSSAI